MFAPNELVATVPRLPSAAAVSRVVVVLPLVPETSATCRPAARFASRFGSIIRPSLPPMTDPSPRPVTRDSTAAVRDTELASLVRSGNFGSVTGRGYRTPVGGSDVRDQHERRTRELERVARQNAAVAHDHAGVVDGIGRRQGDVRRQVDDPGVQVDHLAALVQHSPVAVVELTADDGGQTYGPVEAVDPVRVAGPVAAGQR